MKKRRINRMHKDRIFLMVFREKAALLELYNALNQTDYTNSEDLEITTLEDAVYMRMKNDVSFIFNHELHLYEQQGKSLCDAVDAAVTRCIAEGILESFLRKHRGEVYQLLLTEYNEQKFLEQEREVWKEEGHSEGLCQGLTQGRAEGEERMGQLIQLLIQSSRDAEIERAVTDIPYRTALLREFKL